MKRHLTALAAVAMLCTVTNALAFDTVLFTEDFSSVTLGDSVNERLGYALDTVEAGTADFAPEPGVFSAAATGWTVDNAFDNFGNVDLAYDPSTAGDPTADGFPAVAPPVGTVIGNVGVPEQGSAVNGVDEYEGWTFLSKDFWVEAAGDQDRSLFTLGTGTVAVADPDEYDDLGDGRNGGYYNTGLTTPRIDITGTTGALSLSFDSCWRPEAFDDSHDLMPTGLTDPDPEYYSLNNQTAVVWSTYYDAGGNVLAQTQNMLWDSDNGSDGADGIEGTADDRPASTTFHDDATNEEVSVVFASAQGIAGATEVELTFGLINAGNDWFWAIDNIGVDNPTTLGGSGASLFTEDFETVSLGDSVNEQRSTVPVHVTEAQSAPNTLPRPDSFTNVAPTGWTVDNTGTPVSTLGNDDIGVYEFEGWNFMDLDFWTFVKGNDRDTFTKADGPFAVADGDVWDELGDPTDEGILKTLMESPVIDLTGGAGELLKVAFDSCWRDEDDNLAVVTVDFQDGNGPVEILRWESDDQSAFFHNDNTNESVIATIAIPAGATDAVVGFYYEGGNDWWWAVDNIQVGTVPEPSAVLLSVLGLIGLSARRRR